MLGFSVPALGLEFDIRFLLAALLSMRWPNAQPFFGLRRRLVGRGRKRRLNGRSSIVLHGMGDSASEKNSHCHSMHYGQFHVYDEVGG